MSGFYGRLKEAFGFTSPSLPSSPSPSPYDALLPGEMAFRSNGLKYQEPLVVPIKPPTPGN
jgi:hypothetical protein